MLKGSVLFILFILLPLTAGFCYGWLCDTASRRNHARLAWLVVTVVGLPVCVLLLAKFFNSNTLGWLFGLSLIFGLPLLMLFGAGFAIGSAFKRRMHMSREVPAAQPRPGDGLTCSHLRPLEQAMRSAGLEMRAENQVHLHANCRILREELARRFGPAAAALYEERHFIDRSYLDPKSAFFWCDACKSRLSVVHPEEARAATPWFPAASEISQAECTHCADFSW